MRKRSWRTGALCGAAIGSMLLCLACSPSRDAEDLFVPNDVGVLVVDALLTVGKPLPRIVLTRCLSPAVPYSRDAAAERGAQIEVLETSTGRRAVYAESQVAGVYEPAVSEVVAVAPETTYELTVLTVKGENVGGQTTTPAAFSVSRWVLLDETGQSVIRELGTYAALGDSVYSAASNQVIYAAGLLEAQFNRPNVDAFQIGLFSLDPDSDFVIDPEFFSEEDFESLDRDTSSPALEGRDGTLRLPWFAIFFEGRYKLKILALDRNAFDFVRSIPQNNGGFAFGGNLGGNFNRPITHVAGGIGLFGSASTDSLGFSVHPRP